MSGSATESRAAAGDGEDRPSPTRWKTSARIEAINRQHAEREQEAKLSSRRWSTLRGNQPALPLESTKLGQLAQLEQAANTNQDSAEQRSILLDDRVPAWLVSLIVHMLLVLLLAFLTLNIESGKSTGLILRTPTDAEVDANTLELTPTRQSPAEDHPQKIEEPEEALADDPEFSLKGDIEVPNPLDHERPESPTTVIQHMSDTGQKQSLLSSMSGGRLGDRSEAGRAAAVVAGETSAASEDTLEGALRWIAAHQHNDGGWSFRLEDKNGPCAGKCENPLKNPDDAPLPRTAATGLAMLAFMGAGSTHREGPYAENIRRGIYFLQGEARKTSLGVDLQNGTMYGHGIATLALSEAYVLTGDEELKELVEGTTFMCAGARHPSGGWGYLPGGPPDITLTAWQVIALKTAEQRGIAIPTDVFPRAKGYLYSLTPDGGRRFGYKTPEPQLSTTAIGLLLRLYFGTLPRQTDMREALDYLVDSGPSETNVYYNYYAMLALHHAQHQGRMEFGRKLREYLISTQARGGHESGSWHFPDRYGSVGGRLYTTCLCALILETPYRYVPLHGAEGNFKL